jgi:hypothetical protein
VNGLRGHDEVAGRELWRAGDRVECLAAIAVVSDFIERSRTNMGPYHHIFAPTDFSAPSARGVDVAIDLAVAFGAKLTLMHSFEIPGYAYTGVHLVAVDDFTARFAERTG